MRARIAGSRQASTGLLAAVEKMFAEQFEERILPFDEEAGRMFARLAAAPERRGRPISQPDAMIASIARFHPASTATRNTNDFEDCGIQVVNPWID